MEKCYDYFGCDKTECIMFQKKDDQPCWDTKETLCCFTLLTPIIEVINESENQKCDFCLYKSAYHKKFQRLNNK